MNQVQRKHAGLMGALVADAATLGAHWIYDVSRIADLVAQYGSPAFLPVDEAHYDGGVGYFAHGARQVGMPTQYGAVLALATAVIARNGGFNMTTYQTEFASFFGPGGGFNGYIDRPTRGALAHLAAEQTNPSGIDDDQLPAMATLPAVIAAHHGQADLGQQVRDAVSVTNVNDVAQTQAALFAQLLSAVISGTPLATALDGLTDPALRAALDTAETDSTAYGEITGRACHLPMAMPLVVHILSRSSSYQEAVERNINAGGDNAGRAILIGALAGAEFGLCTDHGIPLDWVLRVQNASQLWHDCRTITG